MANWRTAGGGTTISAYTQAALPSAATAGARTLAWVTDLGPTGGMLLVSNGTRWKPANGDATMAALAAPSASIANTETLILQTLIPATGWQDNDLMRLNLDYTKSGATDNLVLNVRMGTAGTTADTALAGLSALILMSAGGRAGAALFDLKKLSSTSVQKLGNATSGQGGYQTSSGASAASAATTVTDLSANAMYLSIFGASSSTTDTIVFQHASIEWRSAA